MVFIFCLASPLPRGVPGEGPDCHVLKEIVGFGPIPARILGFLSFILALSTARLLVAISGGSSSTVAAPLARRRNQGSRSCCCAAIDQACAAVRAPHAYTG
jgi:hypothetical protein